MQTALVFFVSCLVAACSSGAMQLLFDVPPGQKKEPQPSEEQKVSENQQQRPASLAPVAGYWQDWEAERPPVEEAGDWQQALEHLPVNAKGEVDWSAAVREGAVRPRALNPESLGAKAFQMDFVLRSDKPKFDAWFPHSAHTEWLGCRNCHGTLFKYAENEMTMKDMRKGQYCGACHNEVAFSMKKCDRCHLAMKK